MAFRKLHTPLTPDRVSVPFCALFNLKSLGRFHFLFWYELDDTAVFYTRSDKAWRHLVIAIMRKGGAHGHLSGSEFSVATNSSTAHVFRKNKIKFWLILKHSLTISGLRFSREWIWSSLFRDMTTCGFAGTYCVHFQGRSLHSIIYQEIIISILRHIVLWRVELRYLKKFDWLDLLNILSSVR